MNLNQLRTAVMLMEQYGEGTATQKSGGYAIVRCGKTPGTSRYKHRFKVWSNGTWGNE